MEDQVRMAVAVSLLFNSQTATPQLVGKSCIQSDSMRRPRATHTSAWESSPKGISKGSSITTGMITATLTKCPTQQKWFNLMMRGAKNRMGYVTRRQQPLSTANIVRLLELVKAEAEEQEPHVAREFFKVGAAVALAFCGSLRGNEVFMLDLNGLRRQISLGKEGTVPKDPMKAGTDLSQAPHIITSPWGIQGRIRILIPSHVISKHYKLRNRVKMVDGKTNRSEAGGKLYQRPWFWPKGRICYSDERIQQNDPIISIYYPTRKQ